MDQIPATTETPSPIAPDEQSRPGSLAAGELAGGSPGDGAATATAPSPAPSGSPGFGARGRVRRRARFLRKARELAYRDLGGLVYNLHHFGQRNDALVLAKLATLSRIDAELRALEASLSERQPLTVLREAGITACPRCAAIHSGDDRFCPNCGLPMSRKSELPIAAAAGAGAPPASAPGALPSPAAPVSPGAPGAPLSSPAPASPAAPAQQPAPAPFGAPAVTAPAEPATQTHPSVASSGRSPLPPMRPAAQSPPQSPSERDEQPTEIIRPPASGS